MKKHLFYLLAIVLFSESCSKKEPIEPSPKIIGFWLEGLPVFFTFKDSDTLCILKKDLFTFSIQTDVSGLQKTFYKVNDQLLLSQSGFPLSEATIDSSTHKVETYVGKDMTYVTARRLLVVDTIQRLDTRGLLITGPNPNSGKFTASYVGPILGVGNLAIFDMKGQMRSGFSFTKATDSVTFNCDISDEPAGIYSIKLSIGERYRIFKMVKQ